MRRVMPMALVTAMLVVVTSAVFGGVAAAASPTMTVTPSTGLAYRTTARVHMVGTAGSSALLQQCSGPGRPAT